MPVCKQHCYFIPVYKASLASTYSFSAVCFNEFKTLKESLLIYRKRQQWQKEEKIKLDSSLKKRKKNSNSCLCQLFLPYLVECEMCLDGSIKSHKRIILHVPECPWPGPCAVQPVEFSQDLRLVLRNHTYMDNTYSTLLKVVRRIACSCISSL